MLGAGLCRGESVLGAGSVLGRVTGSVLGGDWVCMEGSAASQKILMLALKAFSEEAGGGVVRT